MRALSISGCMLDRLRGPSRVSVLALKRRAASTSRRGQFGRPRAAGGPPAHNFPRIPPTLKRSSVPPRFTRCVSGADALAWIEAPAPRMHQRAAPWIYVSVLKRHAASASRRWQFGRRRAAGVPPDVNFLRTAIVSRRLSARARSAHGVSCRGQAAAQHLLGARGPRMACRGAAGPARAAGVPPDVNFLRTGIVSR